MTIKFKTHGGSVNTPPNEVLVTARLAAPAGADIAADEEADFGYFFPPDVDANNYLPEADETVSDLMAMGAAMIDFNKVDQSANNAVDATADSNLSPVLTYWGQFLDHELTARTDREGNLSNITGPSVSVANPTIIERSLKNARTPRFDLDSVYGSLPLLETPDSGQDDFSQAAATVVFGLRHPQFPEKMRVGTAHDAGELPDGLDEHRDLPRYQQVSQGVRDAAVELAGNSIQDQDKLDEFEAKLGGRALIGDMRNDENLIIAQFHLSFLRFHNKAVDYLNENPQKGWIADFNSAQDLTRLHYQWLIANQYLRSMCQDDVLDRVLADRAQQFFDFREEYEQRLKNNNAAKSVLTNALPLEFSAAIYRFAHSMVRNSYDYNKSFGRDSSGEQQATFDQLFAYTGGGGFEGQHPRVPKERIIDWSRFLEADASFNDNAPQRVARSIDTELAPPLADMINEGLSEEDAPEVRALLRHLAQRNLLRGYNLKLPTGQALHRHLQSLGVVNSAPIADISDLFDSKPDMQDFLRNQQNSSLHERTPLWFYCLAEAEAAGGNKLGEVGSWIVAATFIGVLLDDPDSALSRGFEPEQSPLRVDDGTGTGNMVPIDSLEKWMKFALVLE